MTLWLLPPVPSLGEGDDLIDAPARDAVTPRELPEFRATLRELLCTDEANPVPALHGAECVQLLARALSGRRSLGVESRPRVPDADIAVDEFVEIEPDETARAREALMGALRLVSALRRDAVQGAPPDELSIRKVVRAELHERNAKTIAQWAEVGMLPRTREQLTNAQRELLDASMPDLRQHAGGWLAMGAECSDLVGVVGYDGQRAPCSAVLTRGGFRRFAAKLPMYSEPFESARFEPSTPGYAVGDRALLVAVWSGETIEHDFGGGVRSLPRLAAMTFVNLATGN